MATLILLRHGQSIWNAADRFAGWTDVPLSEVGEKEAARAGTALARAGLLPDLVHTSLLRRAISTADIALDVADRHWIPVHRTWRLNERNYGALEGRSREEVRAQYGDEQFAAWRRSYSVAPPPADPSATAERGRDARYQALGIDVPSTESLEDVLVRLLPYWRSALSTDLRGRRTVLVVAHGNVLRTLISHLERIPADAVRTIAVPTGEPLRYELSDDLVDVRRREVLALDHQP